MISASVPAEVVQVRTERVAMAVGSIRGYPNGFDFTVHVRLHRADDTSQPRLGILYADGRARPPPASATGLLTVTGAWSCGRAEAAAAAVAATGTSGFTRCQLAAR